MANETLSEQIRRAITASGLTLYRISKSAQVDAAALTRFMQGKSLTLTSVDRIAGVLAFEIVVRGSGGAAGDPQGHDKGQDGQPCRPGKKRPRGARRRGAGAKQ